MKTIDRLARFLGLTERALLGDDMMGPSEVLVCQMTGDVEVWFEGECLFKSRSNEVNMNETFRRARRVAQAADAKYREKNTRTQTVK